MVSDAVRTPCGRLVLERYVTDVTIYRGRHRFVVDQNDSYQRSTDPLAIILRKISIILRQGLELFTRLFTVSAI